METFREWQTRFDAENEGRGGYTSVVFSTADNIAAAAANAAIASANASAAAAIAAASTGAGVGAGDGEGAEVAGLTGKQWFLLHATERRVSEGGAEGEGEGEEEALIRAAELELADIDLDVELDEELLSR